MFRGTLKYNTFIAVLEMVNAIIDIAIHNTDDSLSKLSWLDFVSDITETELIQYLKERKLYVNADINEQNKGKQSDVLIHFQSLGLYVYASTESIMKKVLGKTCLGRFNRNKIDCNEGDILCINSSVEITKEEFESNKPAGYLT